MDIEKCRRSGIDSEAMGFQSDGSSLRLNFRFTCVLEKKSSSYIYTPSSAVNKLLDFDWTKLQ